MDFATELAKMDTWISNNCGHKGVDGGWRHVDAKIDSPWFTVQYLGHMGNAFSICESRCSLIAAAFTSGDSSVLRKAKGAMTGFGDLGQASTTIGSIKELLALVGNGTSGPTGPLKQIMDACYGKGSTEEGETITSLNAAAGIINKAMGPPTGGPGGSQYENDLNAIAHPGDTYIDGQWVSNTDGTIADVGPQTAQIQSLHTAITTIANLFTGASQSMGELQKSMAQSANTIFGLLDKWMQGLYNTNKSSISQETR